MKGSWRGFRTRLLHLRSELADLPSRLARAADEDEAFIAEWVLDNRHLVLQAMDQVLDDLTPNFWRTLPRDTRDRGPRVDALARELVERGRGLVTEDSVLVRVRAHQEASVLALAELWALPAFLRLATLETLMEAADPAPSQRPRPATAERHARVTACIASLRTIDRADWPTLVERLSVVEGCLRERDPAGVHGRMDFETRDRYRKAVEEMALWSGRSELALAEATILEAGSREPPENHVGTVLHGPGRRGFERKLGCVVPWRTRVRRWGRDHAGPLYFGGIAVLAVLTWSAITFHVAAGAGLLLAVLLSAVPAVTVGVALTNAAATRLARPRPLPKLDFASGIPDDARTCVAVPMLLSDEEEIEEVLAVLETNRMGNGDPNLVFALLGDPPDADKEGREEDEALLRRAIDGVERLNRRHGGDGPPPFLLLHRPRRWSPGEGRWMAWERKRGKLHELDLLLLGATDTDLEVRAGDPGALAGVRFVLTLDADTFLPEGVAARLVGTLSHPLNRPRFDDRGQVVSGYTVLQPRVETLADPATSTRFTRLFQADRGLDLYSHAVSDVYQDLFGQGIFAGKGLYDVAAFERSLEGRVPENALLSHDLFEGVHGRTGLVADAVVLEDFPSHPVAWMRRLHRWVRGDWQIAPWLPRHVPAADGGRVRNRLSGLARWMIFDNLRRSLLAPSLLSLALAGWLVLPGPTWWWTVWVVAVPGFPLLLGAVDGAERALRELRAPFAPSRPAIMLPLGRWAVAVVILPWESMVVADAVVRTVYRLLVSRRHLLEWTTASRTARTLARRQSHASWRAGLGPFAVAVLAAVALAGVRPDAAAAAGPVLAAWFLGPWVLVLLSRPLDGPPRELSLDEIRRLRRLARLSWGYFETVLTPEDHWLPPDHLRAEPDGGIAHRTSPTNVGFGLLSTLVAHDLGYVTTSRMAAILANTLGTMERLERHRGHLLNWYDTLTLRPLAPRYVSSVDSGNLAACLMAVRIGLLELLEDGRPFVPGVNGLVDLLGATGEVVGRVAPDAGRQLEEEGLRLEKRGGSLSAADLVRHTEALLHHALPDVEERVAGAVEERTFPADDVHAVRDWVGRLNRQLVRFAEEHRQLQPWLFLRAEAPGAIRSAAPDTPAGRAWRGFLDGVPDAVPLHEIPATALVLRERLERLDDAFGGDDATAARAWLDGTRAHLSAAAGAAAALTRELRSLADQAGRTVADMDFAFLHDPDRHLLLVGYDVDAAAPDGSHYDLFASEARLAAFVAMTKGDLPTRQWLHLGRPFGQRNGSTVLLSWAGTMFEYLMPYLFLPSPANSLSDVACRRAVDAQMAWGRARGVPWGVSESGYAERDAGGGYRYRAFGVPTLALRRETDPRVVVAPYASALALPIRPDEAMANLERLAGLGLRGPLGFWEAADFGHEGERRRRPAVVRAVMAHHQGMVLGALHHLLTSGATVRRFARDRGVAANLHLLHERSPATVRALEPRHAEDVEPAPSRLPASVTPWVVDDGAFPPPTTVLSNGRLSTLLSASGGGGLRWRGHDLLRWRPDPTGAPWGLWIWVRDATSGRVWSAARAPTWTEPDRYEVRFAEHAVEFHRDDGAVRLRTTVFVAPDHDVEIRSIVIVNDGDEPRTLTLTSLGEVALAEPARDRRHPAFAKLFVEAEHLRDSGTLLFHRRTEGMDVPPLFLGHRCLLSGDPAASPSGLEGALPQVDRHLFYGRPPVLREPPGVMRPPDSPAPAASHAPLDPVMSLSRTMRVPARGEAVVTFLTAAGASRQDVLRGLDACSSAGAVAWALGEARDRRRALRTRMGVEPAELPALHRFLTAVVFPYHTARGEVGSDAPWASATDGPAGQEVLWSMGVSGDRPVVVARLEGTDGSGPGLAGLLRAHAYWEGQGVELDLLLVGREPDGYGEPVRARLDRLLTRSGRSERMGRPGGVHYVPWSRLGEERWGVLARAASLVLEGHDWRLDGVLSSIGRRSPELPPFVPIPSSSEGPRPESPLETPAGLAFFNGLGGFDREARSYVVHLPPGEDTPAPWSNVVSGPEFGFVVTTSGGGFTWDGSSGEHRLTPWTNDPVLDTPGESLYLRDEETAEVWSPTPAPAGADAPYRIEHRPDSTTFLHRSHGLEQSMTLFLDPEAPVKIVELTLTNRWPRRRRLTATYVAEWVLGTQRWISAPHLATGLDPGLRALTVTGWFAPGPFRGAFLASDRPIHGFTCDRTEFLGRAGDRSAPAGLLRIGLSGAAGAGFDPCAALQVHVDLEPDASATVRFFLGGFAQTADAAAALERLRADGGVDEARRQGEARWSALLGRTRVRTPEPSMDLALDGRLLHQALACRMWGRSALYQSSGAFGFRDQLQDSVAMLLPAPGLCRDHLLLAAAHQFEEGDVLHWWHPGAARGVRTRCSDDRLWLPWTVARYIEATGDTGVLDEMVPFLTGPPLRADEVERYDTWPTGRTGSLWEHCVAAVERPGTLSPRGVPLIGSCDWNDGLNRVGSGGRGESFWLSWFLQDVLLALAPLADARGEWGRAARWRDEADELLRAVEEHGWDGEWYRRATYDDGTPLGSKENVEGWIDSLCQSWAALTGRGDPGRVRRAMAAVEEHLVRREDRLVLLLHPPFRTTGRDPGYIQGYPPGVRENGGQYTHAAIWAAWAWVALGHGDCAEDVFRLLNPVLRTTTPEEVERYRVEPYVVAADVYAGAFPGRGGWTWYTGSAAWLHRLGMEAILGLSAAPGGLRVRPCLPSSWPGYDAEHRHGRAIYRISVRSPGGCGLGVASITLDDRTVAGEVIPLEDDGREHRVIVVLGERATAEVGAGSCNRDGDGR